MRVNNVYLTSALAGQPEVSGTAAGEGQRGAGAADPAQPEVSTHVPSPELVNLVGQVQQTPEVRSDRLAQVAERLASGYYNTPAAADQTAQALLDADD